MHGITIPPGKRRYGTDCTEVQACHSENILTTGLYFCPFLYQN
jgi:hypothetical protein